MIKKDISKSYYAENFHQEQQEDLDMVNGKTVDEIFAEADAIMSEDNNRNKEMHFKPKKSFFQRLKGTAKTIVILSVLLLVGIIAGSIYGGYKMLPKIQDTITQTLINTKEELNKLHKDDMTVHEYYQQAFFNLFTDEELKEIAKHFVSMNNLDAFINQSSSIDINIIPEEKRESYLNWKQEYEAAIKQMP